MENSMIDPNNLEEQLYYPPPNYVIQSGYISPQEDSHFIDLTVSHPNEDENQKRNRNCLFKMIKIVRIDASSFTLRDVWIVKISIIIPVIIGIIMIVESFLTNKRIELINIMIAAAILLVIGIYALVLSCQVFYKTTLTLEQNSIVLKKIAMCNSKNTVYKFGELERAEIYYKHEHTDNGNSHTFRLYFIKKEGEKEEFYKIFASKEDDDLKGVKYFIDLINQHIQSYMH